MRGLARGGSVVGVCRCLVRRGEGADGLQAPEEEGTSAPQPVCAERWKGDEDRTNLVVAASNVDVAVLAVLLLGLVEQTWGRR